PRAADGIPPCPGDGYREYRCWGFFLLVPWPCRCCCDGCTGCWRDYRDWTARIPRVRGVIPLCSLSWLVLVCTSLSGLGYLSGVLSGTGSFPRPVSSSR